VQSRLAQQSENASAGLGLSDSKAIGLTLAQGQKAPVRMGTSMLKVDEPPHLSSHALRRRLSELEHWPGSRDKERIPAGSNQHLTGDRDS
jgi:hypothetical protein